jgi:DNA-binding XRE family transcriptional regulator
MSVPLSDILNQLSPEDQTDIKKMADKIRAEYMTLQDVRKALDLTQNDMAQSLRVRQVNVSKIENRSDLKLSTLRDYVSALGGDLKLVIEFPDRDPIILQGFGANTLNSHPSQG